MEEVQDYAIALGVVITILLALRMQQWLATYAGSILHLFFLRYFRYCSVFTKRNFLHLTWLQFTGLIIYLAGNIIPLTLHYSGTRNLEQRLAVMATANCSLLFFSGPTNVLTDWLGISNVAHMIMHRWIGRIAALQAILHATIVLILHPLPGNIVTSGYIVRFSILHLSKNMY
jgi:hypothetical protein